MANSDKSQLGLLMDVVWVVSPGASVKIPTVTRFTTPSTPARSASRVCPNIRSQR
jgi:hypothetical protein